VAVVLVYSCIMITVMLIVVVVVVIITKGHLITKAYAHEKE
jgi:hypothetical protein